MINCDDIVRLEGYIDGIKKLTESISGFVGKIKKLQEENGEFEEDNSNLGFLSRYAEESRKEREILEKVRVAALDSGASYMFSFVPPMGVEFSKHKESYYKEFIPTVLSDMKEKKYISGKADVVVFMNPVDMFKIFGSDEYSNNCLGDVSVQDLKYIFYSATDLVPKGTAVIYNDSDAISPLEAQLKSCCEVRPSIRTFVIDLDGLK